MQKLRIALTVLIIGIVFFLVNNCSFEINNSSHAPSPLSRVSSGEAEKAEAKTEALEGLQWMNRARAYPNVDIPNDAYTIARNQFNARFSNQQSVASGTWTSIGPNNVGGRTLCVAIDPTDTNKIWLGSAGGGLWKSTTGGMGVNAWTYVPVGFPVIGVSTIAINPNNPNEMYIGTGETYNPGSYGVGITDRTTRGSYGMGILKSTDGGVTWAPSLNWSYQQQRGIWEIVINPLRPQTVFAATTEGIYKSTDAGANWTQVLNQPLAMDLALHATDTSVIMCGVGNMNSTNKGLYRSSDGGLNWSIVSGIPNPAHMGRTTITMYPSNNDIAFVQVCDVYNTIGFYRTTDKGITWTLTGTDDISSYQGWYCKGMAFMPGDPFTMLVGGVNMYRTNTGGSSFFQVSNVNWTTDFMHSDVHDIVNNPQNPNSVFIVTDGGLFRSFDFGNSYTECTDGYVTSQCYIGSVSQTNPDFALTGLQDNYSIEYNGNPYWTAVVGGDGCYNAIDPTDDFVSFVSYQYLNVSASFDQGVTYNQVNFEPSSPSGGNPTAFLAPYMICPNDPARIYAGGTGFIRSDDQGSTWPTISADPIDNGNYILSIAASLPHPDSVYIVTAPDNSPSKLMLSTDGGYTFTDRSTGLPNRFPRRLAVDPRNGKIVYVVYAGFGTGHAFKSTDAGVTWTDISTTLPDVPFHCVFLDPQFPDVVYLGTDMGLYVSTNGGATWATHNTGMPDWTMVYDLVSSVSDRSVLCFTHGHGAFKRSLNDVISGVNEQTVATPFSISVYPNPVNDNATLVIGESTGPVTITVHDLQGKLLYSQTQTMNSLSPYVRVDVSEWPDGLYIAEAVNGNKKATARILVSH
jgi:photosystem II stability/assembly factor-like uncharacterized protein